MVIDEKVVKIQIVSNTYIHIYTYNIQWDTAGQERYRSITNAYYREAAAIFVCFDLTNNASFASLKTWLNEVANYTDGDVNKLILANKEDEVSERKVSKEAIDEFMKTTGVEVKEVSAKSGKGVEEAFKYMVQKLITQK